MSIATVRRAAQIIAAYYSVPVESMSGRGAAHSIATTARQVASYVSHEVMKRSYPEIGRALDRHHTTVMYAKRVIARRMTEDMVLASDIKTITEHLPQHLRVK